MRTGGLVGRERELGVLGAALDELSLGAGGVVLVAGEAGVGKTTLVEATAARAREAGVDVRWGRCAATAPAFWPWREALGSWPDDLDAGAERFEVFERAAGSLRASSGTRPVLTILDDLHWADEGSVRFLAHLVPAARASGALVVGTFRDDEVVPGSALDDLLAGGAGTTPQVLEVAGLPAASVAALADLDVDAAESLRDLTGGNPFFIGEVLRLVGGAGAVRPALRREVPRSVGAVVRRRVERLGDEVAHVLRRAAVLGRTFDVASVAAVAGDGADTAKALDAALAAGLVERDPDVVHRLRFVHALAQEALAQDLGVAEAATAHAAALAHIDRTNPGDVAGAAGHAVAAVPVVTAAEAAARVATAADAAVAAAGYEEAARLASVGLGLGTGEVPAGVRYDLLVVLGRARFGLDDHAGSSEALLAAADAADAAGDPGRAADALLEIGSGRIVMRSFDRPLLGRRLRAALDRLDGDDLERRADLLSRSADMLDDRDEVDAACRESVELARRCGDPATIVRTIVRHLLNTAAWTSMPERRRLLAEAQAAAARTTSTDTALDAAAAAIRVLLESGDVDGAEDQVRRIAFGDRFARGSVTLRVDEPVLTLLALFRGELDDARRRWSASVDDAVRRGGFAFVAPGSQAQALTLAREDGSVAGTVPFVESLLVGDDPLTDPTTLRCVLALVQAEAGDVDASSETIDLVLGADIEAWAMAWGGNTIFSTCLLVDAALLARHRGAGERLAPLLAASVADRNVVLGMPPVVALGWGTYFVGACELLAGRPAAAVPLLAEAVTRNTAMGARPATARAHLALAQALVEVGDGGGALRSATAAATIAAAGGYPLVERRARDLADRLDGTPAAGGGEGGTTTFVFTDIVGSTAAAARLGDRAWRSVVEGVDSTVRAVTVQQGGRVVKALGDGWMLTFPSVRAGVGAAVELHAAVDGSIELRTGVHTGEAEVVGGDHIGHHVNLAARVSSAAAPGEILVSDVVRTIVGGNGDLRFGPPRTVPLKGIDTPQVLHPVAP